MNVVNLSLSYISHVYQVSRFYLPGGLLTVITGCAFNIITQRYCNEMSHIIVYNITQFYWKTIPHYCRGIFVTTKVLCSHFLEGSRIIKTRLVCNIIYCISFVRCHGDILLWSCSM